MEGLERRELMAFNSFASPSGNDGGAGYRFSTMARNVGTVNAFRVAEVEPNNTFATAQVLPLGTGQGQRDTIDVSGQLNFGTLTPRVFPDVDYFAVDLKAGDILDIATFGSVGAVDVFYAPNQPWFGAEGDASGAGTFYPFESPLQTAGDITIAQTVPRDGRYFIQLSVGATEGSYTMGLRAYRPVMEQAPIGQKQILFLDFDGASYLRAEFDPTQNGVARLSPMSSFLAGWGLNASHENILIDKIVAVVEENFNGDLSARGNNGFFDRTGVPGHFGIEIRNSRDHVDEFGINPYVSRVIIGGTVDEAGVETIGLASSIDIGNFATAETAFMLLDAIADEIIPFEVAPGFTILDTISTFIGNVAAHEAGHYFGAWHQDNSNALVSLMDQGGDFAGFTNLGPDEIFGTLDDNDTDFTNDFFSPAEGVAFGREDTINAMAFNLSTGKRGGGITGRVFSDANRNGTLNAGEGGVGGVLVYADLNGDGVRNGTEPGATTAADGTFALAVAAGTVTVRMVAPVGFNPTTPTSRSVTVANNSTSEVSFGLNRVISDVTGFKWNDLNGNGIRDTGEPGLGGVYVYLDLDGDNRLDLGEPHGITRNDGSYSINFPGPGTYTIREVMQPGFIQTFPGTARGEEHTVVFNGTLLSDNYNFGNQSVQDYGDAPAPFPTLIVDNGAVHGFVPGLHLGNTIDFEADGQPSANALGDDNSGIDDEDGVTLRGPLAPGATTTIDIGVMNSTGSVAYLSAWIDINGDGDWTDAGEKFLNDVVINSAANLQNIVRELTLPTTAVVGNTYARFRLSQTRSVGITGYADGGEVEDYAVSINATAELANNDSFDVPRGALAFPLNVLGNDFDPTTNPLTITDVNTTGTRGQVQIHQNGRSILYTPSDRLGPDSFIYTVRNAAGGTDTARVDVNVVFQSQVPIAIDDSFNLPQGSSNQALNVLGNDIPSIAGGTRIIATSAPTQGGTVSITSGGQSLRYTPAAGFNRTEQFTYTVADSLGQTSTAQVTVHLQPGTLDNDLVNFIVQTFANDGVTPISTIPAGQRFKVRVSVDDLRTLPPGTLEGLGSAYLDLLYTDGLVATTPPSAAGTGFPFDVQFGPLFTTVKTGDSLTPGIFNEIGATQPGLGTAHNGPAELFTLTLVAVNPGIAEFIADPADALISDVVLLNDASRELTPTEIRFGRTQLTIVPSDSDFVYAVDDSYPNRVDSNGNEIVAGGNAVLRVLENDNRGASGQIEIVNVGSPANGTAVLNNNSTPSNTLDDFINYRPRSGFVGVDQFTYTILSDDGIQSTAQVTVTVGAGAAADDLVDFDVRVFNSAGVENGPITVGQTFDVQIWVDDMRAPLFGEPRGVFAAYADILYNAALAQPTNTTGNRLGFDVQFGQNFDPDTAVGDAFVPGLINEFGTFQTTSQGSGDPLQSDPVMLATIRMIALAPGQLRLVADPADVSPFQDTLLFQPPDVVPIGRINYDVATVTIRGSGEGESPFQNQWNRMDVNNDKAVSPIDALLVLNRLNRSSAEGESGDGSGGDAPKVFWDVNGDRKISPIDALQIINFLNRRNPGASGEGEAGPQFAGFDISSQQDFAQAADSIFDELGRSSLLVEGNQGGQGTGNQDQAGSLVYGPQQADDDDDDNLLMLLSDQ